MNNNGLTKKDSLAMKGIAIIIMLFHHLYCEVSRFDKYEIDFLIKLDGDVIPVEVKSSKRTTSKSLNAYIEKYNPVYSIRISEKNFGFDNGIKSVPLYAVFCIYN